MKMVPPKLENTNNTIIYMDYLNVRNIVLQKKKTI